MMRQREVDRSQVTPGLGTSFQVPQWGHWEIPKWEKEGLMLCLKDHSGCLMEKPVPGKQERTHHEKYCKFYVRSDGGWDLGGGSGMGGEPTDARCIRRHRQLADGLDVEVDRG